MASTAPGTQETSTKNVLEELGSREKSILAAAIFSKRFDVVEGGNES